MKSLSLVLLLVFAGANFASAQNPGSSRQGVNSRFDLNSPKVGEQLPNLKAYDAEGNTIRLGQLKGDYTVLVFGCLT